MLASIHYRREHTFCLRRLWCAGLILFGLLSAAPSSAQPVRINFQPPGEVPEGYLPDHGEVFGDRGNGYSYGWDANESQAVFSSRRSSSRPDLQHETFFEFPEGRDVTWEIAIENGVYDLYIVSYVALRYENIEVEGIALPVALWPSPFQEDALTVALLDGRLTINSKSFKYSRIYSVDMRPSVGPRHVFPSDGAKSIAQGALLHWSLDPFYQTYNLYLGESFDDINEGTVPTASGLDVNSLDPGLLEWGKTYYWRVDGIYNAEDEGIVKGKVASFQVEAVENSGTARFPYPASGSMDVSPRTTATWRAGRDANSHVLYMSTEMNAVRAGTAASIASDVNSMDLTAFDLLLGETYYWRVDEVKETDATVNAGPVWSFSTSECLVIDDFERYNSRSPNRPWQTWLDSFGFSADEYFPEGYAGNGTGSQVGHDTWAWPPQPNIMEMSIVHAHRQSLPLYYYNDERHNPGAYSQTDRMFDLPQDWTAHGIQSLVLHFFGEPDNTGGSLYIKVNDEEVTYPHDEHLQESAWHQWNVDVALLNIDLHSVTSLHIGTYGPNTTGTIYIDDIGLYRNPPALIESLDPGVDALVAAYGFQNNTDDSSGHGRHGASIGNPTYEPGIQDQCLAFDGTGSQYVDLGTFNPSEGTGQLSVAMWVKRTWYTNTYQGLMGKRDSWATEDMMWQIELDQNTGAIALTRHGGEFLSSFARLERHEWTHICVTYDGEIASLFMHGQLTNSSAFTLGSDTDAALVLGACGANGGNPFRGLIDEVTIYNRALSLGEVRYQAGDR